MSQLPLNLNTKSVEEVEYNGWILQLTEENPKQREDRYAAARGQQFWSGRSLAATWHCHIFKPGHKHDGACIVADAWTKQEAIARTQAWIDWACM